MYRYENKMRNGATDIDGNRDDYDIKKQLVNYIYDTIDLSKFNYEFLEFESELYQLAKKKYFISANFSGSNCLLVFNKNRDRYYSFLVNRKTLSYNIKKLDVMNVEINNVTLKLDLSVYKGTILNGIFIMNKGQRQFIITDVYYFKGQEMLSTPLDSKILTIKTYLESNYYPDDRTNTLMLTVNKLYKVEDIRNVSKNIIPNMNNYVIKGICFYPEISGTRLIYTFGNELRESPTRSNPPLEEVVGQEFKKIRHDQYDGSGGRR